MFLTFRSLGSKGWIKVECLVRHHCRFKGRILLLLSKVFPVDGGEKVVTENIIDAIRTWKIYIYIYIVFSTLIFFKTRIKTDLPPTLQKKEVYAWWKVPAINASNFAIFYILPIRKPEVALIHFSFRDTLFFYLTNTLVFVDIDQDIH